MKYVVGILTFLMLITNAHGIQANAYEISDALFADMAEAAKVCGEDQAFDRDFYDVIVDEFGNIEITIYFGNSFVDAVVYPELSQVQRDNYEILNVLCDK